MSQWLARNAKFSGTGWYRGRLFDLGSYPGAVSSRSNSDKVLGDLYVLADERAVFGVLDRYEGDNFCRRNGTINLENGNKIVAWIYLLSKPGAGLRVIPGGDYMRFTKQFR